MINLERSGPERGAITIHVAIALMALLAFSSFVIDYGLMWVSRTQAQNAADAGALAGAISLVRDGGTNAAARLSAETFAVNNAVWGQANVAGSNIEVGFSGTGAGEDPSIWPCLNKRGCVRVDVMRGQPSRAGGAAVGATLPTFFSKMVGINSQGVRATATARTASGNKVNCLLPFAVIDRWADNFDPTPDTTQFANDALTGTAGWTPNDAYTPASTPADVYVGPYGNNPAHTGWRVDTDYGRQLILKDGSTGNYSTGWSNLVYLPGSTGANDVGNDIENCNVNGAVGIATAGNLCTAGDEANGCLDIKTGVAAGPIRSGVNAVVAQDSAAVWNPTAPGPEVLPGAVVGGQGMSSPRIRPIAIIDINHYQASGCSGSTCIAKVANIIGFFLEGMCNTVTLDPGLTCDDPSKDVVGRIVTLPGSYATGVGTVDESAAFIKVIRLVR